MKRMATWFWLSAKRWLKHPGFAAALILLPFLMAGVRSLEPEEREGIAIGLWPEGEGLGMEIAQELVSGEGMFEFILYASEEEARQAVERKEAECAYLFPEDLEERLKTGDYRRCITVYKAPSTILDPIAGEVVYSALASRYDGILLQQYADEEEAFGELDESDGQELAELYQKYRTDGSTFRFEYAELKDYEKREEGQGKGPEENQEENQKAGSGGKVFPVRGLGAVIIFLAAFFSACTLGEDEKKGLFLALPFRERPLCKWAALMAPLVLTALSVWIALWAAGEWEGLWKETATMAAYVLVCGIYGFAAKELVKDTRILAAFLPVLAAALLVICPVFADAGMWFDGVNAIRKFLPAAWYLGWFAY